MNSRILLPLAVFGLIITMGAALPGLALAQVTVQGLVGEMAQDATVTITGSGFGVKSPAAPLKYDSFQNGEPGETLQGGSPSWNLWAGIQPEGNAQAYYPKYSDAQPRFLGDVAARQWFGPTPHGYNSNCTIGLTNLSIGQLYVSGWIWNVRPPSGPETGSRNIKVWQNCVGTWGAPTTRWDCYPMYNENSGHIYTEICGTDVASNVWGAGVPSSNTWHRLEIWHDRGAPGRDEVMTVLENNQLVREFSNAYSGCDQNRLYLMSYHDQYEGNGAEMEWFWGEIYVDNTQARVEIGDNQSLSACTRKEIQIPETWDAGTITIRVNKGAYQPGENLYLFVVDADGNVNDPGFPLVMGGSFNQPEGPGVPGQPVRQ